jgi:hypothetical protein
MAASTEVLAAASRASRYTGSLAKLVFRLRRAKGTGAVAQGYGMARGRRSRSPVPGSTPRAGQGLFGSQSAVWLATWAERSPGHGEIGLAHPAGSSSGLRCQQARHKRVACSAHVLLEHQLMRIEPGGLHGGLHGGLLGGLQPRPSGENAQTPCLIPLHTGPSQRSLETIAHCVRGKQLDPGKQQDRPRLRGRCKRHEFAPPAKRRTRGVSQDVEVAWAPKRRPAHGKPSCRPPSVLGSSPGNRPLPQPLLPRQPRAPQQLHLNLQQEQQQQELLPRCRSGRLRW